MPVRRTARKDPTSLSPLQRLLVEARENLDLSYREIEMRSGVRPDGRPMITRQTAQSIATTPIRLPPDDETIAGLSTALGLSQRLIRAAIGETLGYRDALPAGASSLAHDLARRVDALASSVDRAHILWTLRRLVDAAEALEFAAAKDAAAAAEAADAAGPDAGPGEGHAARNGVSGGRGAGDDE